MMENLPTTITADFSAQIITNLLILQSENEIEAVEQLLDAQPSSR